MKHAQLQAIVHNVADSLGSGISLMTGFYDLDVYSDARKSPDGALRVDLLRGVVTEGDAEVNLLAALNRVPAALAAQCEKCGGSWDEFKRAEVIFRGNPFEIGFTIIVEDHSGKYTETDYSGSPAQRVLAIDGYGRLISRPSRT
jgi:hypothetical protein